MILSCLFILTIVFHTSPQIPQGEAAQVNADSKLVTIERIYSSYPPQRIYYEDGKGYGGTLKLLSVAREGSRYKGVYGGEIYPVCVNGMCPN